MKITPPISRLPFWLVVTLRAMRTMGGMGSIGAMKRLPPNANPSHSSHLPGRAKLPENTGCHLSNAKGA